MTKLRWHHPPRESDPAKELKEITSVKPVIGGRSKIGAGGKLRNEFNRAMNLERKIWVLNSKLVRIEETDKKSKQAKNSQAKEIADIKNKIDRLNIELAAARENVRGLL